MGKVTIIFKQYMKMGTVDEFYITVNSFTEKKNYLCTTAIPNAGNINKDTVINY